MKNIIIFGGPGTGKGTISKRLSVELGLIHLSTGDLIRANQESGTKIGLIADRVSDNGGLLPDEIVSEMVKIEIINNPGKGFVFDGFPRTPSQSRALDQLLQDRRTPVDLIISLDVPKWVAKDRILERAKTSNRKDDTEEIFNTRWSIYEKDTIPSIEYFRNKRVVHDINGEMCANDVYNNIKELM